MPIVQAGPQPAILGPPGASGPASPAPPGGGGSGAGMEPRQCFALSCLSGESESPQAHLWPFPPTNRTGCKTDMLDGPQGSALVLRLGTQGWFQQTTACEITYTTFTRTHISLALTEFSSPPSSQLHGSNAPMPLRGGHAPAFPISTPKVKTDWNSAPQSWEEKLTTPLLTFAFQLWLKANDRNWIEKDLGILWGPWKSTTGRVFC